MPIPLEAIIGLFNVLITVFLPYFFNNNLWTKELPKTIEEFNREYEPKINKILSYNTNKSSELLEKIISNNIKLTDESNSEEYIKLLEMHGGLLIEIRKYIEIEGMHNSIENLYQNLTDILKNIKNITGVVLFFYLICILIYYLGYLDNFQLFIYTGIWCLTFYSIFKGIELYLKFKSNWKRAIYYKKWIQDNYKNIPRIIDNV